MRTVTATTCPRCGYDLRGAATAVDERRPVTCSECGLELDWDEVLHPARSRPPWCVEFARARRLPIAAVATARRSLRPFRFWSSMRMSNAVRPGRLAVYVGLLMLLPVGGYALEQSVVALRVRAMVGRGLYGIPMPPPPALEVVADAVLRPTAVTSGVTWARKIGGPVYPGPRSLHQMLHRYRGSSFDLFVKQFAYAFGYGLVVWALVPAGFVLLPQTRRRARIRYGHVGRIAAYGVVVPSLVLTAALVFVALGFASASLQRSALATALLLARWGLGLGIVIWWAAAIGRYLRLPHAWLVASVLPAIGFLLVLVVLSFVDFRLAWPILQWVMPS